MGSLTSKHFAYKGRPWEITARETISLKDPFYPLINVETIQGKILRILPVVGYEEWISDNIRFFKSIGQDLSYLLKITHCATYSIENILLQETQIYHRKYTFEKIISFIVSDIEKNKNISILLDSKSDIKLFSTIRSLDCLKKIININIFYEKSLKKLNPIIFDLDNLENYSIFILGNISDIAPLLYAKVKDFEEEYGDVYYLLSDDNRIPNLGNNITSLKKILNGRKKIEKKPLFITTVEFSKIIPSNFESIILKEPIDNLYFNNKIMLSHKKTNNYIICNTKPINKKIISNNNYLLNSYTNNLNENSIYIPTASFWMESNIYLNLEHDVIKSTIILKTFLSPKTIVDLLMIIKFKVIFNNYKKDYTIFKRLKKTIK